MADNGRDTSLNSGADEAPLSQDDPLFELARLMGEPAQAAPAEPVQDAPKPAAPFPADDDLEAQLLAELGVGEPVAAAPVPTPEPELAPMVEAPAPAIVAPPAAPVPQPSIEDELAALLGDEPAQPVIPAAVEPDAAVVEADAVAVEAISDPIEQPVRHEAIFDAPADGRESAPQPVDIEEALDTDLDDFMYVDFDAPSDDFEPAEVEVDAGDLEFSDADEGTVDAVDTAMAGFDEPVELAVRDDVNALEAERAPAINETSETAEMDEAALFADFDNALDDEFDALFAEDSMPSSERLDEPELDAFDTADASLEELDTNADDEAGLTLGLGTAAAAVGAAGAAGMATVASKGDELLDHIGMGNDDPSTALDELDQLMNPARAQKPEMPAVETTDIGALADEEFSDFDVPDLPVETPQLDSSSADNSAFDDLDFDLDFDNEPAAAAVSRVDEVAPFDGDDNGLIDDFEAELAKDMEFVSHNRAAPLPVEDDFFGEPEADDLAEQAEPKNQKRGFFVAGIVLGVALLGAVGVFALTGGGADPSAGPVVVEADPDPIKVQPEEPGGSAVPNQDLALFNGETEGGETQQEQLVTTSEEPVDIANAPGAALPSAVATKDDERLLPDDSIAATNNDEAVTSVSPRRVRTLVVRSDGTLVEQPAEPAPVAEEPAAAVAAVEAPATVQTAPSAPVADNGGVAFTPPATAPAAAPAPAPVQVPVRRVETQTIAPPIIADRPNNQPVNIVNPQANQQTQIAAAPQAVAPAPAAAPAPVASTSPFVVQIASVPSREGAQQAATNLQQRFTNVLGGRGISIQQAQIDGRGTFYRVRVGAQSREDANALCEQYKRAGGSCFVTR